MPEKKTIRQARARKREGKSPSAQAGEFVHEEIKHVREGKHGARSAKQAIAIGLSKARRAGVKLQPPRAGKTSASTRAKARSDFEKGQAPGKHKVSPKRSRGVRAALRREGAQAASSRALSRQARRSSRRRGAADRSRAARRAVRTKGKAALSHAAKKAARTRARGH